MSSWYFWESFDRKSTDQRESWALKVWLLLLSFTCSLPISRAVIFLSFFSFFSLLCTLWEELLWQHESDDTVWHWVWRWYWDPKFFGDNICSTCTVRHQKDTSQALTRRQRILDLTSAVSRLSFSFVCELETTRLSSPLTPSCSEGGWECIIMKKISTTICFLPLSGHKAFFAYINDDGVKNIKKQQ